METLQLISSPWKYSLLLQQAVGGARFANENRVESRKMNWTRAIAELFEESTHVRTRERQDWSALSTLYELFQEATSH